MSNVRALPTRSVEINQDVVDVLRSWLEKAEAGEFNGVVIVGAYRNGSVSTAHTETDDLPRLIGALVLAQHQLVEFSDRQPA